MRIGTKSLLFGSHQFILHPLMVMIGWRYCYGRWPRDWRIYVACVVHDWGYHALRCEHMDDTHGQLHPAYGRWLMNRWFGRTWGDFTAGHSRYYAQTVGIPVSPLMRADKMATVLLPWFIYLPLVILSGEAREYIQYHHEKTGAPATLWGWYRNMRSDWRRRYGKRLEEPGLDR